MVLDTSRSIAENAYGLFRTAACERRRRMFNPVIDAAVGPLSGALIDLDLLPDPAAS